jgi:hypothetical protein
MEINKKYNKEKVQKLPKTFLLVVVLRFELKASYFLGRCSTTSVIFSALFALVSFGSHIFAQAGLGP